jgi:hypothetical protein
MKTPGKAVAFDRYGFRIAHSARLALVKSIVGSHDNRMWGNPNPGRSAVAAC